jgi:molybdate transport system permease protein
MMQNNQRPSQESTQASFSDRLFSFLVKLFSTLLIGLFVLPLIALIWRAASLSSGVFDLGESSLISAVSLSLLTTTAAMLLVVLLGTPLAYLLSRHQFRLKKYLAVLVELPIVIPPVVAGLALLSAFGRRGLLGGVLGFFGLSLPFTPMAVVIAQLFVSSPFYIRAAQNSFNTIPMEFEEAARIDGADAWKTFRQIILPLSSPALLSGLLISWARALGEFGATVLFAGNLAGSTQTMSLLVYAALERDLGATYTTALILLALAVVLLGGTRLLAHLENSNVSQNC